MKMKRIISTICAFALAISLIAMPVNTQAATAKYAYFTVERLTIGQGLLVQPIKVEIKDKDTVSTVFERVMSEKKIALSVNKDYGWYLSGIKNADTGKINIPEKIREMDDYVSSYTYEGQEYSTTYKAPTNSAKNNFSPDLMAASYNDMAGWMFMINNEGASSGADSLEVKGDDVIRVQFSVFGWGNDIGIGFTDDNLELANKDELVKKVADVQNLKIFSTLSAAKSALKKAIKVLEKFDATKDEVKSAVKLLSSYANKHDSTNKIKVARAKIQSIKNVKTKRAKIKVKKIKGATGYQFKYSKHSNLKKAKVKTTKKRTIKTKKFKKKQTCYAIVRAYVEKNKVKHYGKWSKKKKVKIKK